MAYCGVSIRLSSLSTAAESSRLEGIFIDRRIRRLNEVRLLPVKRCRYSQASILQQYHADFGKMGKLRAKRRAAERRHGEEEDDLDDRATTSEIAGPISTICTCSRSATSITETDDDR